MILPWFFAQTGGKSIAFETALKPALKPGVTTVKFLKPERKNNFISWRVINLFIFSGFKNFAIVTAGFKAGFKPVSRGHSTDHPRRHVPRTTGVFHSHVICEFPLQGVALSFPMWNGLLTWNRADCKRMVVRKKPQTSYGKLGVMITEANVCGHFS